MICEQLDRSTEKMMCHCLLVNYYKGRDTSKTNAQLVAMHRRLNIKDTF